MKRGIVLNIGKDGQQGFGWPDTPGIRKVVQLDFFDRSYLLVESKGRTLTHDDLLISFLKDFRLGEDNLQVRIKGKGIVAVDVDKKYAAFAKHKGKNITYNKIDEDHLQTIKALYPQWTFETPTGALGSELPAEHAYQHSVSAQTLKDQTLPMLD